MIHYLLIYDVSIPVADKNRPVFVSRHGASVGEPQHLHNLTCLSDSQRRPFSCCVSTISGWPFHLEVFAG